MAIVLLSACQSMPDGGDAPTDAERTTAIERANWDAAHRIRLEMVDYGYRPREVRLRRGQPYILTLTNVGAVNHYFDAPEFLRSIAARKAEVDRYAEFKAPYFSAFEVHRRGGTLELYFVPLRKGEFHAHCHIADHKELGVEGRLIVE